MVSTWLYYVFAPWYSCQRVWHVYRGNTSIVQPWSNRRFYRVFMLKKENNMVSSIMGRDDSCPATVPSVVPTGDCSHLSIHYIL